ncbi:unnamed protein product, partial [Ectocarpus sp. 12 AP-2014]
PIGREGHAGRIGLDWLPGTQFGDVCTAPDATLSASPTAMVPLTDFGDNGTSCLWPPFVGSPAIDERSPMPLCKEPGACVVATLSSMTPVDLTQMVERAFLAE